MWGERVLLSRPLKEACGLCEVFGHIFVLFMYLLFYVTFNSQGHIVTGSLQVEEPVHTT